MKTKKYLDFITEKKNSKRRIKKFITADLPDNESSLISKSDTSLPY